MIEKLILILIWYHMFKMKNTYNWYQDVNLFTFNWYQERIGNQDYLYIFHFGIKILIGFFKICFQCLIYFQLAFLKIFLLMCSLSIGIMMHYIDIFFNWYHVCFDFTPWSIFCFFVVSDKNGKNMFY